MPLTPTQKKLKRRQKGQCWHCQRPAEPQHTLCRPCMDRMAERNRLRYQQTRNR